MNAQGATVGMHPHAKESWGISSTIMTKMSPDMTIGEAAKLLGVDFSDVAVVSGKYVARLYDHWDEAGTLLEDAKRDLAMIKEYY